MADIHKTMKDSAVLRWTALVLVSSVILFGYMFVDVLSPLQTMLEKQYNWSADVYGVFSGSAYFLNVFVFFLFFVGIILDKAGVRFTAILSGVIMLIGGVIKFYAVSSYFVEGNVLYDFLDTFWISFPATAKLASIGFAIFGCGSEMAGITVSRAIVKWFDGKELALAMSLQLAIARLGVFAVFRLSPYLASLGTENVARPVAACCGLLGIGLISFVLYACMDKKLDRQMKKNVKKNEDKPFKIKDFGILFTNKTFLIVAFLCMIYYAAIFPFQKFATAMLENRLGIPTDNASALFSWFPVGTMVLTPFLGWFLDKKGKGATMLTLGAILMMVCHAIFALYPFQAGSTSSFFIACTAIVVLGISFSLVPAALWPSVPKLVENRYLGSAYSVVFWFENIGLWAFPIIIGKALIAFNPNVGMGNYDYTAPMLIFASLGIVAFFLGIWLKVENKKKGYGLEAPNIKNR
jgi:MFS family permease